MKKLTEKQRIYWKSRRGLKELDLLLIPFVENVYLTLSDNEQQNLAALLEAPDPQLYSWLLGYSHPENAAHRALCEKIYRFHQNLP